MATNDPTQRLLVLTSEFPPGPGGVGTHAWELARHLARLGWQVVVLTPQDHASEAEIRSFNQAQCFKVVRLSRVPTRLAQAAYRFYMLGLWSHRWRPDILVASGRRSGWLVAVLTRWLGKPWVAIGHGSEFLSRKWWERVLTRWAFGRADRLIAVSDFSARLAKSAGVPSDHTQIIPNGADGERYRDDVETHALNQRLDLPGGPVILTVGSVTERKAHDVVIRALPEIVGQYPTLTYLVAGIPTRRDILVELARQLGVERHVRFLGRVEADDLSALYNLCDLFVLVSRQAADGGVEGYGIAVVEAALSGKPAVVSRGCGTEEVVVDGETGLLVDPDDPAATARAILHLLADDGRRRLMGQQARTRALLEQTWAGRVVQYDSLLRELVRDPMALTEAERVIGS